jgi:hypothetical protein
MANQLPEEPSETGDSPATTGMQTPQAKEGESLSGKLDALNAMKLLDRAIQKFGPKSDKGKAALAARAKLTEEFGEQEEEIAEFSLAEIKRMVASLQGPGEPPKPPPPQQQRPQGAPPQAQPPQQQGPGPMPQAQGM